MPFAPHLSAINCAEISQSSLLTPCTNLTCKIFCSSKWIGNEWITCVKKCFCKLNNWLHSVLCLCSYNNVTGLTITALRRSIQRLNVYRSCQHWLANDFHNVDLHFFDLVRATSLQVQLQGPALTWFSAQIYLLCTCLICKPARTLNNSMMNFLSGCLLFFAIEVFICISFGITKLSFLILR